MICNIKVSQFHKKLEDVNGLDGHINFNFSATLVAALIGFISAVHINKSKTNDSLQLFRYTKLYEISHELARENRKALIESLLSIFSTRKENIVKCCGLAKLLIDKEFWSDIDEKSRHRMRF